MRRAPVHGLLILAAVVAVYGQALTFDYVSWDDQDYVRDNVHVQQGLTGGSVVWAFTTTEHSNWHPLTWLSLMADVSVHGTGPFGHHLTNVALHGLNALLVYLLLRGATGRAGLALMVALLFAVHPLHVESVAWITERKDVLSTFFGLLALGAWGSYGRRGGLGRYLLVTLLFALSLMAKQTLVTLPAALLLLDAWPLGRWRGMARMGSDRATGDLRGAWPLVLEKLPLLVLSGLSAVATVVAQSAADSLVPIGLADRLANAAVSYVRYLGALVWPTERGIFYPHPALPGGTPWTWWQVGGSLVVLAVITALVLRHRRRGFPVVGWGWFLGTLVPMIGVVQVGHQAMADRYTYVPYLGLYVLVVFGVDGWAGSEAGRRRLATGLGSVAIVALGACAVPTVAVWRTSTSLFEQELRVAPHSWKMHNNLGGSLMREGRTEEALEEFRIAVELKPGFRDALNNLGLACTELGLLEEAVEAHRRAVEADEENAEAALNLGNALARVGEVEDAREAYLLAVALDPEDARIHYNLANAHLALGDGGAALEALRAAVAHDPDHLDARYNLAVLQAQAGQPGPAVEHYREVVSRAPEHLRAQLNLGQALAELGRLDEAREHAEQAARLGPEDAAALAGLARVILLDPGPTAGDLALALDSASRASALLEHRSPEFLATLAAAQQRNGRDEDALDSLDRALDLARSVEAGDLVSRLERQRATYADG